ncbi:MAG: HD domain-containing protein [Methanomicrobiales archaeon]|jgi:exopolyphosphatase/guanosine-5'-triphosphate,3'-diphosphate pyrophosphatase|nr:HD domain-containing protein [Methanomicrobiales archaeon]
MISLDKVHACAKIYDITYTSYAHEVHVSMLCGLLFDELHSLFPTYTIQERDILICAGLLHDIGNSRGIKGHHKASYELIHMEGEKNQHFGLSHDSLEIVALIARYHRKAVPSMNHEAYAILSSEAQERVRKLSALLRIADGLDYLHDQAISKLTCTIQDTWIECQCTSNNDWSLMNNMARAKEKAEPLSEEFQKQIRFYGVSHRCATKK